jgi:hypothetical protein
MQNKIDMDLLTTPSCNTATLDVYVPSAGNPWNIDKVKHIYKRLNFSATQADLDDALSSSPEVFIDGLIDAALVQENLPAPLWANWSFDDYSDFETQNNEFVFDWRLVIGNGLYTEGLKGRLAFFWSNHFVTELDSYFYAPYLFKYYDDLQTHSFGNFKDFTHAMGINSTMLLYLNGFENTENSPNENYARELYELFTLGEGNGYTQSDITETARALTGYNHWETVGAQITFDDSTHDTGIKTIFDQEGAWGYDDVINILFEQRGEQIATTIITKLYQFFVSPAVDAVIIENIIAPLSQVLIDNNFEMAPVLRQLFKSEHFFDERARGVIIKSPLDVIVGFTRETGFFYNDQIVEAFLYYAGLMGQEILDPPDVSGWQRDETWINASTLTGRWQLLDLYLNYLMGEGYIFSFVDLARELTNDSIDPVFIARTMVDYFVPRNLHTEMDYETATIIFKADVPQNYYDDMTWSLSWSSAPNQVNLLLRHIFRIPEFQLK